MSVEDYHPPLRAHHGVPTRVPQVKKGHIDYVRALAAPPVEKELWLWGSHDHTQRLWYMWQPEGSVLEVSHGAPMEASSFLPGRGAVHQRKWQQSESARVISRRLPGIVPTSTGLIVRVLVRGVGLSLYMFLPVVLLVMHACRK